MIDSSNVRQVFIDALNDPRNQTYRDVYDAIDCFPFWDSLNDYFGDPDWSSSYDYIRIIPNIARDLDIDITQWAGKLVDDYS